MQILRIKAINQCLKAALKKIKRNPKCSLNLRISEKKCQEQNFSFDQTAQLLQQLRVSLLTGNPFNYTNKGKSLK
ncbi:hypothetical protein T05_11830 [Trichinella murrelli]|uniref:Uncharacterized protein n=1 Tax=Trichinella murrelli TaxID=144512 RepID=A0A0V0TBL9_9BILA|nr:hypothetical protein T05_11830 [Trichinella murrelli]